MARLQLDNAEFEGANAVYLLGIDDGPLTLVDTGVGTPPVEREFRENLDELGVNITDVEQILLTHHHADHAGLAGTIQAESDATVRAHPDEQGLIERTPEAVAQYRERLEACLFEWGMPSEKRAALRSFLEAAELWSSDRATVQPMTAGDTVRAGDKTLEAVHLPGHTVGQIGFLDRGSDETVLYAGDALLPTYTPNVGGADVRVEAALATYVRTLSWIIEAEPDRVLPGHRQPIEEPVGRAREILGHHRDRTERVVDVLDSVGSADAWTVSDTLFGDLEAIHILHGPGEAAAHLEHLVDAGVVSETDGTYTLLESDIDSSSLIPIP